jgi:hypothetical protein
MELSELAAQTRTMYRANYEGEAAKQGSAKKKWWNAMGFLNGDRFEGPAQVQP